MPRWKALPDELDPQIREFASQLRRLIDRSGLSIAAVADRTGYSKTSWERYLNGRLLAPRGAVVALAEVTGTDTGHLTTMWELAERAWSRSELRRDLTMEALRISQARAALGDPGPTAGANASTETRGGSGGGPAPARRTTAPAGPAPPAPQPPRQPSDPTRPRRAALILTGVLGVLLVIAAAVLLTDLGGGSTGDDGKKAGGTPTATPSAPPSTTLPAGVKCAGAGCAGQDPEAMGCGGAFAATVARARVGTAGQVEVRYSRTCGAAWARITGAGPGDTVRVTAAGTSQNAVVDADADAYTPMVAVAKGTDATACATLRSGAKGCTGEG
ncbi:helix-turn-helix domain-containing protein [Streptomyces sp. NPDC059567]|uniref:helix-turn-helix domain-containing protein n=1 Tax=Streptomyces sp. NPDC059567 TaxID=3346867 RepID=UPI0036C4F120